jgi:hypothetical protein
MGTIRKERFTGMPLLLDADTFDETVADGNPIGGRERRSPGPTAVLISSTGNPVQR